MRASADPHTPKQRRFVSEYPRPIFMHSSGAGVADIVAFPRGRVLWVEAKAPAGRQTAEQVSFQQPAEREGHAYIVARSSDEVLQWLKQTRARI